jgi:integrase
MSLRLVRRKKSPYWVMRGTLRGIRVEESTGTGDRRIAEEIRAKRESEILAEAVYGRRATATFAQAALSYLENGGNRRFMARIISHFGNTPLAQIDQDALDRGSRKLYPDGSGPTRNRQFFTPVSAVLKHAALRGLCAPVILQRPKPSPARLRWITPDEADRLIDAGADHLRPLVTFLLLTGARVREALWLDWKYVDLARGHVMFPKTKNGNPRGCPLHRRAIAALANLSHREGDVFRRPDGLPYQRPTGDEDRSAGTRIKTAFRAACRRAGIVDFHPHDCRHTWATWHYAANRDLGALQKLGGWKSVAMVMRYAHVNVDELRSTIDRLPGGKLGESDFVKIESDAKSSA